MPAEGPCEQHWRGKESQASDSKTRESSSHPLYRDGERESGRGKKRGGEGRGKKEKGEREKEAEL